MNIGRGRGARLVAALVWTGVMIAASSIRRLPHEAVPLLHYDKILHVVEYGVFAWLWGKAMIAVWPRVPRRRLWIALLLVGAAWGAFDEWYQGFFGRSQDVNDWLADGVGAAVGAAIALARRRGKGAA
ncbi:MAG: VanZ family protein [Candidatus Eisenbacteria bacterium]|nr:VanZ family protein [Candidatus Eisenbacteria bacterium]